jgi:hypothetical protein
LHSFEVEGRIGEIHWSKCSRFDILIAIVAIVRVVVGDESEFGIGQNLMDKILNVVIRQVNEDIFDDEHVDTLKQIAAQFQVSQVVDQIELIIGVESLILFDDVANDIDASVRLASGYFDEFHYLKITTAQIDKRLESIVVKDLL